MTNSIIQVEQLKKSYGQHQALRGISFTVERGEIFALLGPNGAGKSTTLQILCTCLLPDSGIVRMDGLAPDRHSREIRRRIGIVFQNSVLDDLLSVEENLWIRGSFYGLHGKTLEQRIAQIAACTGIQSFLHRPYGKLSGGQRRRCDIARALLHYPKILFLDEPTTGLDPEMRAMVWETIAKIRQEMPMTVILTTHYMEEAAQANHMVILKNGVVAVSGTPAMLKNRFSEDRLILFSHNTASLKQMLMRQGIRHLQQNEMFQIPLSCTQAALPLLQICNGKYFDFEVTRGNMDDAYLRVIEGGAYLA